MVAAPVWTAVAGDLLCCLGLGLLLAAVRQAAGLALGGGPVLTAVWDAAAFAAAAVLLCGVAAGASSSGVVRWYMAAGMLAGALGWRFSAAGIIRRFVWGAVSAAAWPFAVLSRLVLEPIRARMGQILRTFPRKVRKKPKNSKKRLQKPSRVLYN